MSNITRILLVSQSQDAAYIDTLTANPDIRLTVLTGKYKGITGADTVIMPGYDTSSFKTKLASWLKFRRAAKKWMKKNVDSFDVVFFTSNPPVNQSLVRLAQRRKKKTVYLVWDVYPDIIERVFGKKAAPVTALWRKKNRRMYSRCDKVITIGEVMRETMLESYPELDISVIPYHADTETIRPIAKENNPFCLKHELVGKKVFMYSGKMGTSHGFGSITQAAKMLSGRRDIVFVMIGRGTGYPIIEKFVRDNPDVNMLLMDYLPVEMLPYSLTAADVAFISIKAGTEGTFLPSKVYDAMAAGSAILSVSGAKNDISHMTEELGVGINVPDDADKLRDAILRLADDSELLAGCRKKSRETAELYSAENIAGQYAALFSSVSGAKQ